MSESQFGEISKRITTNIHTLSHDNFLNKAIVLVLFSHQLNWFYKKKVERSFAIITI